MPRNSSGTYSLPSGNPVVTNTLIQSTWANTTLSDTATALTDSLDRNGRGAMLAPLKNVDGSAVAPSVSFSSEGTLGIYRAAAGTLGFAVGGALVLSLTATGLTFTTPLVLPLGSATAPAITFTANTNTGLYSPGTNQVALTTNGVGALFVGASQNVGIGGANALGKLQVIGGDVVIDNAANYSAKNSGGTASSIMALSAGNQLQFGNSGAVTSMAWATGGATRLSLTNTALQPSVLIVSALGEAMRLVNDAGYISFFNTAATTRTGYLQANTGADIRLYTENGASLLLGTNAATRVVINTAGNVGFGVVPSGWGTLTAIEGTAGALIFNSTVSTYLSQNAYYNGSSWIYKTTGPMSLFIENSGGFQFLYGVSGTAGNAVSLLTAGVFDFAGNFLIGLGTATSNSAGRGLIEINGSSQALLALDVGGARKGYFLHDGTNITVGADSGSIQLTTGGSPRLTVSSAGVITDSTTNELGWKNIPPTANTFTRGGCNVITAGVTINNSNAGDTFSIYNNSASSVTITQGPITLRQGGTANTGNRTLLARGFATLWFLTSSEAIINGNIT